MMTQEQLQNKILSEQEYSDRKIKLHSSPLNVILCTSYNCNMKCIFCLGRGNDPDFNYDIYKNLYESKLKQILKKSTHLHFTGYGEVLLLPEIEEFLDYLNTDMPETNKVFTTNGATLSEKLVNKIINGNYSLQISLHTSNHIIHKILTQSDFFGNIVRLLDYMIMLKRQKNIPDSQLWINLLFLATSLNIENLPDFVDFAGQRGINTVICNYITIFKPEHIGLSCFFLPETTNRIFEEAQKRAQKYNIYLNLPPQFGIKILNQEIGLCKDPWQTVFIDALGNVLTCCYSGKPIGNINEDHFEAIWNGEQYMELRNSFIERKPHKRCKNCFKFSSINIDDIRSHITFRDTNDKDTVFKKLDLKE